MRKINKTKHKLVLSKKTTTIKFKKIELDLSRQKYKTHKLQYQE